MAIIIESESTKYAVVGAGLRPGNYGASEEPYIIACDSEGKITSFTDFADNVKVIDINGKAPKDLLNKQS